MKTKARLCDAKFLSVACAMRLLSREEALTIYDEHQRYVSRDLGHWGCGEVALELGLLTQDSITRILTEQERLRAVGQRTVDPVDGAASRLTTRKVVVPSAVIVSTIVIVVLATVAIKTKGDFQVLLHTIAILSLGATLLLGLLPSFLRVPLTPSGRLRWITVPFCLSLASFGWAHALALREAASQVDPVLGAEMNISVNSIRLVVVSLLVLTLLTDMAGKWRHWQLFYVEQRTGLLRRLVAKVYQYTSRLAHVKSTEQLRASALDLDKLISKTISRSAQILLQDPWDHLSATLLRLLRKKAYGALSVWYLEPTTDGESLFIRHFVAPGAPETVIRQLEQIQKEHRPAIFDEDRFAVVFAEACDAAREDGKSPRSIMLSRGDRSQFMSVTGYVYAKKRVLVARDATACPAFDRSYRNKTDSNLSDIERRWLDFNSFACFPVLDTLGGSESALGVLIAFKNIKGGFRREEWSLLASTAKLLGLLIRSHELAKQRVSAQEKNSHNGSEVQRLPEFPGEPPGQEQTPQ